MKVRLAIPLVTAAAVLALPALASAASAKGGGAAGKPSQSQAPPAATVKITHIGKLSGGKARIYSVVPAVGTVKPFVAGQRVEVSFYRNGKRFQRKQAKVRKGKGDQGVFRARIRIRKAGKYAVSAKHKATAALGGDGTVRKSWKVRFPALRQGKCGDVVVGFKKAMRKMGYVANSGRCFGGKTARGVLAYRKVNGMTRSFRAGKGLVKRAFAGRGGYRVRHPGAGRHVEAPLGKQVLVFAKGKKPYAIYPTSSGTAATPTVTGHYTFQRTEPGYNNLGMYYSWYFHGGYAIHGYESVPNYPASHGCLRTFIADQPEIYNRIQYGEDIFVF
ncbi:MAG TPA: L,D-transpeptidase [Solirubrobacterales bacterium]|nr:L,D-transpeptidase [Solirubrobacterales bacterium]